MVGVVDARALRRAGLVSFLADWAAVKDLSILAIAPEDITTGLSHAGHLVLGVLNLGDASLTSETQLGWLRALAETFPGVPMAVISDSEDRREVTAAVRAGARAFLPTTTEPGLAYQILTFTMLNGSFFPPEVLLEKAGEAVTVSEAAQSLPPLLDPLISSQAQLLTARQMAVLAQLQAGMSNRQIGDLLGVRESTVKEHVRHIMRKLGASNRTQAALGLEAGRSRPGPAKSAGDEDSVGSLHLDGAPVRAGVLLPAWEDSSILRVRQAGPPDGRGLTGQS